MLGYMDNHLPIKLGFIVLGYMDNHFRIKLGFIVLDFWFQSKNWVIDALFFVTDSTTFRRFSYSEIQKSTDNFSTIIGKGGFGTVYKAHFADGLVAAVKRMYRVSRQREKEFCKEMEFLGRLHHRHLVTLRGFCITKTERC